MQLEVIISFGSFRRGQIIDLPDGVANLRIARGFCRPVEPAEKSIDQPPHDKAIRQARRKKGAVNVA